MWNGRIDGIAFLPGSLQRLVVRAEGHGIVVVPRAKEVTVTASGYVFLTERLQGVLQTPLSQRPSSPKWALSVIAR